MDLAHFLEIGAKMKNLLRLSHLYLPYLIFTLPERALVLNKRLNVKEFQTVFAFTEKPNPLESRYLQPILKYFTHFHFDLGGKLRANHKKTIRTEGIAPIKKSFYLPMFSSQQHAFY